MAAHRRPRQRALGGGRFRTAVTIAFAGAATATALDGTGHAEPRLTPAQVEAKVDRLYREAEAATEKYNGAKEKAEAAERRLRDLRDEAARKQDGLNTAREALGSAAAAQYRAGGLDPALQLALSSAPERYLDGAEFVERAGIRQKAELGRVREQLREVEELRGAARAELSSLKSRQTELKRHKKTITGKLGEARRLLSRLTAQERARMAPAPQRASRSSAPARDGMPSPSGRVAAPNSRAAAALAYAYGKIGSPYVWGATGPNAFDCSGLTQAAYRAAGISLPRTTYTQIGAGRRVSRAELAPGDLVFFYSGVTHVGLYVGNGQMVHAPNPSSSVRVDPISSMPFAGAVRVV
ncbi:NlpC/P60 family protein [Streptomyces sp. DH24]|uniref:C40 family peptidase n=1 Tax=Streptomyces sp. DH24 TaxID=3040123 RepID=UPI0024422DC4|nr:C40 family peptidase [Streptomyces sp. DH24]MDG9716868.1 NlpC/P60 family protein [Streptomyces sp. DH24]